MWRAWVLTQLCGWKEEVSAFEEYFYHIMAQRGSGEYALRWLLAPYAWAHNPLDKQLHKLKVGHGLLRAGFVISPVLSYLLLASCRQPLAELGPPRLCGQSLFIWTRICHTYMQHILPAVRLCMQVADILHGLFSSSAAVSLRSVT